MKILLLAGSYPPETGGIAQFMHAFATGLQSRGVHVEVIANPALPPRGYIQRVEACRDAVLHRFRRNKFDRIVASSWSPYAVHVPEPFDVFCHGMDLMEPSRSLRYRLIMKRTLHHASRVLANSNYTASLAKQFGARPERIILLHPGVDCERFHPPAERSSNRVILSIGRLVERKGFDMVLRALPRIIDRFPDMQYWCAGDGPDRDRLQRIAQELNVFQRVHWLGEITEQQKLKLYQSARIFVMPNRVSESDRSVEGFGIVFLEAAACGLPAIAGNSGGAPDAVLDGETGYLVDPLDAGGIADRLIHLLTDDALRTRMGNTARRRAQTNFREAQIAERYLEAVQETGR